MGRGTARRAVEGQSGAIYGVGGGVDIAHLGGGNAEDAEAERREMGIAAGVAIGSAVVPSTVDFHDQPCRGDVEVRDVSADRVLAANLQSGPPAQSLPQQPFGEAHLTTQAARFLHRACPSTKLRLVPLPILRMERNCATAHDSSLSLTTLPPCVSLIPLVTSSSSGRTGRPDSLSQ